MLYVYVAKWHYATWGRVFHIYGRTATRWNEELPHHIHTTFFSDQPTAKMPENTGIMGLFIVGESAVFKHFKDHLSL